MSEASGMDRLLATLMKFPVLGHFSSSFFPEWRRHRVEDEIYLKRQASLIAAINAEYDKLQRVDEEALRGKTQEFRKRLRQGFKHRIAPHLEALRSKLQAVNRPEQEIREILHRVGEADVDYHVRRTLKHLEDDEQFLDLVIEIEEELLNEIEVEVFAVVKEACRRHCGKSWDAAGNDIEWEMVPFDVQLCGAHEIHSGKVVEMATGEGKTLVALMPLYINALWGYGAHLVTVNDYLARRDSEWMGEILNYLGLTVGCLDNSDPGTPERRVAYQCDVTYGTNNEFGFDYLRDNMARHRDAVVQRGHHFAIIDEVDSILIDEARTPLIISGPVDRSTHQYDRLNPIVQDLVRKQNRLVGELAQEAMDLLEKGDEVGAGERMMWCEKAAPKHARVAKLYQEPRHKKLSLKALDAWTMDKRLPELDDILYFIIDERGHSADLTEKGRNEISPRNPEMFVITDLVDEISQIESNEPDPAKRAAMKAEARRKHEERSEELHNISQLLRAYMLFEKDTDYVVQENRVTIVDEFTGRLMTGRRWSDGLHQAVEAKEGVKIERETQTLATITIQNYFRLYEKLSGMTGTAETEAGEFDHTYKMAVQRIPTNQPVVRVDNDDVIYKSTREKYNAIIEEIEFLRGHNLPILVGTVSVDVSETLARMLKRKKIPCNVLNAKQHQSEAEIVRNAGQMGVVTIATNMAGRGTDIKLGPGVIKCKCEDFNGTYCPTCPNRPPDGGVDKEMPPCGLQVIGSERHDSRRIDRQLRGRSGRQGDPGSSRFFLSLEDNLMRLFGSEKIAGILTRWGGLKENEEIQHPLITRQIGKAQSKVEGINFDRRKKTLEYDDVMNRQRDVIYSRRARALFAAEGDCRSIILESTETALIDAIETEFTSQASKVPTIDVPGLVDWVQRRVPYVNFSEFATRKPPMDATVDRLDSWRDEFITNLMDEIAKAFDMKAERLGPELLLALTQFTVLHCIDSDWRDHLLAMDELRTGIGLRGYAQVNPLHEYQREALEHFEALVSNVDREIFGRWFRMEVVQRPPVGQAPPAQLSLGRGPLPGTVPQGIPQQSGLPEGAEGERRARPQPFKRDEPKVKPNDPCPCGSGKKYKKCHGKLQ